jgi:ATP-binding cassette subfamily B protein
MIFSKMNQIGCYPHINKINTKIIFLKTFPHYTQADAKDCGPTCLKIIAKHYGKALNIEALGRLSETTKVGSNLLNLSDAAESLGFRALGVKLNIEKLLEAPLPCMLHWNANHYVVLYKIKSTKQKVDKIFISDPGFGLVEYTQEEFLKRWIGNKADETTQEGIALFVEPTPKFLSLSDSYRNSEGEGAWNGKGNTEESSFGFKFLSRCVWLYKSFVVQIVI